MSRIKLAISLAIMSLLLFGCADLAPSDDESAATPPSTSSGPIAARGTANLQPAPIPMHTSEDTQSRPVEGVVFRGTGQFVKQTDAPQAGEQVAVDNGDISLHFVNASIADVAKSVFGDLLKLDYVVSPTLQGTVTLETSHPISKAAVLPALQSAFRLAGATAVEVKGTWRVVPTGEAPLQGEQVRAYTTSRAGDPSFAIEIVSLRYVSAEEMQRLLTPLAPQGAILRVDQSRNMLVLGGSADELGAMRDQISTFDVDWMAGMSFALLPLEAASAKSVADELREILGREGGPIGSLVRIVPIERMNALLLISPQPTYLDKLRKWVDRLDRGPKNADGVQLYVYRVQNGRAVDLANVLHKVFNKSTGTSNGSNDGQHAGASAGGSPAGEAPTEGAPVANPAYGQSGPPEANGGQDVYSGQGAQSDQGFGDGTFDGEAAPQITADETNNALLILATSHQYSIIESALKNLDIWPLQVLIETSIAEVTLTNELQYGVQYYLQSGNFATLRTASDSITPKVPVPGFAFLFSAGKNVAILDLLESKTKIKLMSAPQMMVLNNQTATLQVGNEVPVQTQSATSVQTAGAPIVSSIEYRNTGVLVKLTPRVNESGLVLLDIGQEVSDVAPTTTSGIDSPSFTERKFTSSVAVRDGETIALGGLISDSKTDTKTGIPILSDLPYVGPIFGTTSKTGGRTELLVLITPHIVHTERDAATITEEIREKMQSLAPLEKLVR